MTPQTEGTLRGMRADLGFISRSDGSCSFSSGKTVVWAAVNGPGDSSSNKKLSDKLAIEGRLRAALGESESLPYNSLLQSALSHTINANLFPRAALQVTVHELQNAGSLWSAAITAAGLAVLDAAIPTSSAFCGVQVVRNGGKLIVDANLEQEAKADALFLFAFAMARDNPESEQVPVVIGTESSGGFTIQEWQSARNLAREAANHIFSFFQECLQRKYSIEQIS